VAQQGSPPRRPARLPVRGRHGGAGESGYSDDPDRSGAGGRFADESRTDRPGPPAAGSGPRGDTRSSRDSRDSRSRPDACYDDTDEDLPPWAGPSIFPAGPGQKERRPPGAEEAAPPGEAGERPRGRAAATRARRSRRRLVALGGLVLLAVVVLLAVLKKLPFEGGPAAASAQNGLVTTFQPGDIRAVPDACQAVSSATLSQYLPGKRARAITQSTTLESQCTWTLDARPVYRVLEVTAQAYAPNLLSTGDGSATFSAIDGYGAQLQAIQDPPRSAHRPKARLGAPRGLGNAAFSALQVWRNAGSTTDFVTVVARERNVVVTVTLQGLDSAAKGGYGPVPVPALQAGALAVAREALAGLG
jgi:hypothetical protein